VVIVLIDDLGFGGPVPMPTLDNAYGCFGVLYSASFWNGSHTVS
jgi:hypothetical protein